MICFVYGFPSIVSALQFEWAWQNPCKTLKIQENEKTQMDIDQNLVKSYFYKQGSRISIKKRLFVLYSMLTMNAWKKWPLKIKIFDQRAWKEWETLNQTMNMKILPCVTVEYHESSENIKDIKKVNINHSTNNIENDDALNTDEIDDYAYHILGKIDIHQDEMTQTALRILEKIRKNNNICMICQNECDTPELDSDNAALIYSQLIICPTENCLHVFHLLCLAKWIQSPETENDLLIDCYNCPSCKNMIIWGDCIRIQYCILRKTNANLEEIEI